MSLNPALSVRTERYSAAAGRTPEIAVEQAKRLMATLGGDDSIIGQRNRALIAGLVCTAARAGAVASLRLRGFAQDEPNTRTLVHRL